MSNPFDAVLEAINGLRMLIETQGVSPQPLERSAEIIDRIELGKRLSLSHNTIVRWEKAGKIPVLHVGPNIHYNWPKVVEALENPGKKRK